MEHTVYMTYVVSSKWNTDLMENIPLRTTQSAKNTKCTVKHNTHLTENLILFLHVEHAVYTDYMRSVNPLLSRPRNGTSTAREAPQGYQAKQQRGSLSTFLG
jgi:hypothetical protein